MHGRNDKKQINRPRILSAIHSRQGLISGRVVTVLGVSLVLALLGMVFAFVVS